LVACSRPPDRVFVPAPSFEYTIEASTGKGLAPEVRVGEPLTLHANRSSGPWVEVVRPSLPTDACWIGRPPLHEEPEVADNLRWVVEPEGRATFNLGLTKDHTRVVRFAAPGRYALHAISSMWCSSPKASNVMTVVVGK
jgi:hypothetical protein